jgi:hypothetical protein
LHRYRNSSYPNIQGNLESLNKYLVLLEVGCNSPHCFLMITQRTYFKHHRILRLGMDCVKRVKQDVGGKLQIADDRLRGTGCTMEGEGCKVQDARMPTAYAS